MSAQKSFSINRAVRYSWPVMLFCRTLIFVSLARFFSVAAAQQIGISSGIRESIDENRLTVLKGNTHPLARAQYDRGPAPSNLPLDRMLLILRRTPSQEDALKLLLDQQQNKSSQNYHRWLTPTEFGQQFGPSDQAIESITSWLQSHGFQVRPITNGRGTLEFSGTAAQVRDTFHTEIHKYVIAGEEHWANSSDPQIPTALTSIVAGIATLHNFPRKPQHRLVGVLSRPKGSERYQFVRSSAPAEPLWTTGADCGLQGGSCYALAPYDFAIIYNVLPLWTATSPIDGTGQTIAIVSQSDIYPQDFSDFREDFDLPPTTLNIIYDGPNPGKLASQGDELESDLDVEWSGAVAKGATIDLVVSASTNSSAGVDLSANYIVDNNIAPVMSESYGACELDMGTAGNQFYNELWQQAAAEGITVFVSAGDSGSASCDQDTPIATQGLSVSGISSTPYNVAVGGTDFDDLQDPSTYWKSYDSTGHSSAKSYIPETTWNDSCTNSEFFSFTGATNPEADCNAYNSRFWPFFVAPVGGGGGASSCTTSANQSLSSCAGGYVKPSWQAGAGVPNDGARDVPDVSLFAADGLNASFYVVCETDIYSGCAGELSTLVAVGGTSASAPAFAGLMAMVNQETKSRQGNANYSFYPLAAQPEASCNSMGTIGPSCIFYDVTTGTIAMPCQTGSPDCVTNVGTDQTGVLSGYDTTAGYDRATGLGSVNAFNLVNSWGSVNFQPTVSTLSLDPTTPITHGSPVNVNITVTPKTGTGTPTGMVALQASTGPDAGNFTLANGSVNTTTGLLPGGSYTVTAYYAGDGTYAASNSSPGIAVTVNPEPSTTTVQAFTLDKNGNSIPFTTGPYGASMVYLQASVAGKSGEGVATGTVNLSQSLNGTTTSFPGGPYSLNSKAYFIATPPEPYPFFPAGSYSIGASYSGDASFMANSTLGTSFTITQAPTSTAASIVLCGLQNSECIITAGSDSTILATVSSGQSVFGRQPTGTMTFYSNGTPIGSPVAVDSSISPPVASIPTSELPLGQNNVTAQYSGDANFTGSTSSAALVDIVAQLPPFAITANPSTITASPGQSGSTTLTFAAQAGFTGSTTLTPSMCFNLPAGSACSFSPASVTFTSSATTVPVTLTVTTTASGSGTVFVRRFLRGPSGSHGIHLVAVFGIALLLFRAARRRRTLSTVLGLAMILSAAGCGGGSGTSGGSGGGGGTGGASGTPAGNYTFNLIVAINGQSQVAVLTLNVQ